MTPEMEEEEWNKTRDIDNPLSPWVAKYKGELDFDTMGEFRDRPPMDLVIQKFRSAKLTAFGAAVAFTIVFVIVWPCSMLSVDMLDQAGFTIWTTISRGWAYVAAAFIIIVPLLQELMAVRKQLSKNREGTDSKSKDQLSGLEKAYENGGMDVILHSEKLEN